MRIAQQCVTLIRAVAISSDIVKAHIRPAPGGLRLNGFFFLQLLPLPPFSVFSAYNEARLKLGGDAR